MLINLSQTACFDDLTIPNGRKLNGGPLGPQIHEKYQFLVNKYSMISENREKSKNSKKKQEKIQKCAKSQLFRSLSGRKLQEFFKK